MSSGAMKVLTGSFIAAGAAQDVKTVGFKPRGVKVINVTHPGMLTWVDPMPDASALKEVAAGTKTYITTLGITPLANGFTFGFDTTLNQAGDVCYWECHE